MPRVGRYRNTSMSLQWSPDDLPDGTEVEAIVLPTPDRSATTGTLYRAPGAAVGRVVTIMHPRVDCTHHYLVPGFLREGWNVWTQRSRWVNNDLNLVHERVLIDIATAHEHLRQRGYEEVHLLGNSGGASLYAFYAQQSRRAPDERLTDDPSGAPLDLTLPMPQPASLVLLAPHPGQGDLLRHCIDPSVTDEADGASVDPSLDMYDPANGFGLPPGGSHYTPEFLERYRAAQLERIGRIDEHARALLEEQRAARRRADEGGDTADARRALVPAYLTVYRTDADPRTTDLGLDPSSRDYGSIFGVRPDIINYGAIGFGRLSTPQAWLSTWSALSTRAALRLTAPEVKIPTLIVTYTADNSVFPADVQTIYKILASPDKSMVDIEGDHYGLDREAKDRTGGEQACATICKWLAARSL